MSIHIHLYIHVYMNKFSGLCGASEITTGVCTTSSVSTDNMQSEARSDVARAQLDSAGRAECLRVNVLVELCKGNVHEMGIAMVGVRHFLLFLQERGDATAEVHCWVGTSASNLFRAGHDDGEEGNLDEIFRFAQKLEDSHSFQALVEVEDESG